MAGKRIGNLSEVMRLALTKSRKAKYSPAVAFCRHADVEAHTIAETEINYKYPGRFDRQKPASAVFNNMSALLVGFLETVIVRILNKDLHFKNHR